MNHSWMTRVFSLVLAMVMVVGLIPATVFATELESVPTEPVERIIEDEVLTAAYTVEHYQQNTEGTYDLKESESLEGVIGELTDAVAKDYEGFVAQPVEQVVIAAEGTTVVTIYYDVKAEDPAPATASYTVEHYQQTETGYVMKESETLEGTVGATTNAVAKDYEGFAAQPFEQAIIAAEGTVVAIYYNAEVKAADEEATKSPYSLTVASEKTSNLAPGVTETEVIAYDKNGDRIRYFVVNADMATNDTVEVKANYYNNDNTGTWGKATVVEQANAAKEKRGYNVVATTNAAYYNVSTGQPTGGFVMEGVNINGDSMGNQYEFFAVMKDGTAMIGKKNTFSQYSADIQEAVAGHLLLVWDGKLVEGLDATSKYPRSTVGIKANGDVVLMLADGNQKPTSAGLTFAEQGQLMLELGCVTAIELDGGGSATYAAKLEGSDEIVVRNNCCDGTVRSVSNTLMVISNAVADGTFDHANLSTEYAYYAPNSKVDIAVVPVDAAGNSAELPEDAAWSLSDESFGTVADGVFTSTGKLGTVTVNLSSAGKVIGSTDVTLVHPTSIAFSAAEKTVPYGKTSDFTVTAMYNGAEVYAAADAYNFVASAGSMDGFIYTAPTDDSKTATVTATYKYADIDPAVVTATFGKGSDILYTFETDDPDRAKWGTYFDLVEATKNGEYDNGYTVIYQSAGANSGNLVEKGIKENVFLASRESGAPVYSGDYSLGYTLDYTQSVAHGNWQYAYLYFWGDPTTWRDVNSGINGTRLGMWMYIPEEAVGSCARLCYTYTDNTTGKINTAYLYFTYQYVEKGFSKLTSEKIPEAGWAYVYCDMNQISNSYVSSAYYKNADGTLTREAASNYAPAFIQFIVSSSATGAEKCTFYIDDITLDYSDVVDDRDAPIVSNPKALDDQNTYNMGSTLNFNTVSFTADVAEDTSHGTNFTGLDASTAQIYVDGQKVKTTYSVGKLATANLNLANGVHDVSFEIADKQGNYTKLTKQITINGAESWPKVTLEGSAPGAKTDGKLYTGAQYDLQLKTDKVEAIDSITTKIWLNSASKWSLQNMSTLPGFTATYTLDELACMATITVKRTGNVTATGVATLATIPVYAWAWDGSAGHDATYQWNTQGCAPQITVSYDVKYGQVTYTADHAVNATNYVSGFGGARKDVKTELDSSIANLKPTIKIWHSHTAEAVTDVPNTCTADGHTGRTMCSVCKSILNWGTTKATGHKYELTDGELKCHCGETFTGTWTDGKIYVNGVQITTGWYKDSYYIDGVLQTGILEIGGKYYDLGEDGISKGLYTGLLTIDGNLYYSMLGEFQKGWQFVDDNFYFFARTSYRACDGYNNVDGKYYTFEDHKLVKGALVSDSKGIRYYWAGTLIPDGWEEIDGNTYYFYNGFAHTGVRAVSTSRYGGETYYYLFGEDGIMIRMLDGLYEGVYYQNGEKIPYLGLIKYEGDFYYIGGNAQPIKNKSYYITKLNDVTYDNGAAVQKGTYTFDETGKMVLKNGLVDGCYYVNNVVTPYAGLIKHEGNFYYIGDHAQPI